MQQIRLWETAEQEFHRAHISMMVGLGESPKLGRDVLDDSQPPDSAGRTLREIEIDNGPHRDRWSYLQQASAEFQQGPTMPVGQKSEMADAHKLEIRMPDSA
jgi:hypothetical protein